MRIMNGLGEVLDNLKNKIKRLYDILFLVKYVEHLECFISCSTNSKTALVFGWMEKSGLTVRKYVDFVFFYQKIEKNL